MGLLPFIKTESFKKHVHIEYKSIWFIWGKDAEFHPTTISFFPRREDEKSLERCVICLAVCNVTVYPSRR